MLHRSARRLLGRHIMTPSAMLLVTQNCPGLNNAIAASIQSTSLGTAITLASGYPAEGYYCVDTSGVLQSVGTLSNKPAAIFPAGVFLRASDFNSRT